MLAKEELGKNISLLLRPQRGLTEKNISQKANILACYLGEKRQEDCETHKY